MSANVNKKKTLDTKTYMLIFAIGAFVFLLLGIIFTVAFKPFEFLSVKDKFTLIFPNRAQVIATLAFYILAAFCVGMIVVEIRNNGKGMSVVNKRRTVAEKALFVGVFLFFTIFSLFFVYLLGWAFLTSVKADGEFFSAPLYYLPENEWHFENYVQAFKKLEYNDTSVIGMIGNSLYFAVTSSLLTIFFHCCTGYVFAKYRFKGKNLVFSIVIFTMVIPIFGTLAPLYRIIYKLGITNSYAYVVICCSGFGGQFLVAYGFFKALDWAYAEAAMMDGAGHMRTYLTIMLPLATPIIMAYFILGFIASWNDYMTALLYLDKIPTLATGLYEFGRDRENMIMIEYYFAGVFISIIPTLLIFTLFADKIMNSLVIGGLKG